MFLRLSEYIPIGPDPFWHRLEKKEKTELFLLPLGTKTYFHLQVHNNLKLASPGLVCLLAPSILRSQFSNTRYFQNIANTCPAWMALQVGHDPVSVGRPFREQSHPLSSLLAVPTTRPQEYENEPGGFFLVVLWLSLRPL